MASEVLYVANPSMFRNHPFLFILCVIFFIPGLFVLLAWKISAKAEKIHITEDAVLSERGLLSKERIDLQIKHIRTVRVKQGLIQRMFGAGNVEIYTAGDVPEIVIAGIRHPHHVRSLLQS